MYTVFPQNKIGLADKLFQMYTHTYEHMME